MRAQDSRYNAVIGSAPTLSYFPDKLRVNISNNYAPGAMGSDSLRIEVTASAMVGTIEYWVIMVQKDF
jgi:hypothetical protein